MDSTRFDRIAITIGLRTTRRTTLSLLAALGLTGLVREEASAVCAKPGATCNKTNPGRCCSGICRKKQCRCPQRICCQCTLIGGSPYSCSFVTSISECSNRCILAGAPGASTVLNPQRGTKTTVCQGIECSAVLCTS